MVFRFFLFDGIGNDSLIESDEMSLSSDMLRSEVTVEELISFSVCISNSQRDVAALMLVKLRSPHLALATVASTMYTYESVPIRD